MKLTVEKQGEIVKAIKIEYTPEEALIINHAMRRYATDEEVDKANREVMEQMLEVEPIFVSVDAPGLKSVADAFERYIMKGK